ncbi:MAG: zinc-binding alcohol dehydrogenase family protein, partial [Chloroflexi bacterium]|nr:zinc-binding alcohol dehydrogenase family protein [Chloroflexota bacterium]
MHHHVLRAPGPAESHPLQWEETSAPRPGAGQLLLRVRACGVCHTDLHIVEGELHPPAYPVVPGHQVVGTVEVVGEGVQDWAPGERAGMPWLHDACGECRTCQRGEENLCARARFTGLHLDGGFAEYVLAEAAFAVRLPASTADDHAAPLLCAGIIGYRSLRKADLAPGEVLGLVGFGASAHLALQVARSWGCTVAVFSRGETRRRLALELGAQWAGTIDEAPPVPLDRAVIFAPAGELVRAALAWLRPGGTLAINAVHMSDLPSMAYASLYGERT